MQDLELVSGLDGGRILSGSGGCWQDSGPCRWSDWGPPFLAGCRSDVTLNCSLARSLPWKPARGESPLAWQTLQSYVTRSQRRHPITFAIFCWFQASVGPAHTGREAIGRGHKHQEAGMAGPLHSPLASLVPQGCSFPLGLQVGVELLSLRELFYS